MAPAWLFPAASTHPEAIGAPHTRSSPGPGQASGAGAATDGSRLYRNVELEERGLCTSRGQDIELSPLILSAPLSCPDLRDPSCWTASKPLCWQSEWRLPGGYESGATRVRPWEEGTTIVDSETNNIYVVMRLDKDGLGRDCNAAALLQLHGSQLEFKQMLDSFPSGCSRFVIRYHPPSRLYYSLTNPVAPPRTNTGAKPDPCGQRDVLVLAVSHDLVHWRQCRTVLTDDTGLSAAWYTPHNTSSLLVGFQYVHWVFDQHDILYTVRAAYRGARDSGQANRYLFGRLEDFASQCSE